jgi:hypothetical protein
MMRFAALVLAFLLVSVALIAGAVDAADPVTVTGVVRGTGGAPFPGVTVTIRNETTDDTRIVTTDTGGRYSHQLPVGSYSITATYSGYRANVTYTGIDRTRTDLDFTMSEVLGTVTGQVTDGSTTLSGVLVTLTGVNASFSATSTAPLGTYLVDNVTPGTYMVSASKVGYNTSYHNELVTLEKGSVEEISFTLQEVTGQLASLSGTVTYNGEPLAEVKVVLAPLTGEELVTTTNSGGNYSFDKVPPGDYVLRTSKDGYIAEEKELTIEPLKGMVQDVTMKRNTLPGNTGFILDYDLSHSLMVVALGLALFISAVALIFRLRIKKPEGVEIDEREPPPGRS